MGSPINVVAGSRMYVTVTGAKQGIFKGDTGIANDNRIAGLGFLYGVLVPQQAGTGTVTGKRQYSGIAFTKEWGGASLQFLNAAISNEVLKSVVFEFVRTDPSGKELLYYRVTLTATVTGFEQVAGDLNSIDSVVHAVDEITLSFAKIDVEDTIDKTSATDEWSVA